MKELAELVAALLRIAAVLLPTRFVWNFVRNWTEYAMAGAFLGNLASLMLSVVLAGAVAMFMFGIVTGSSK